MRAYNESEACRRSGGKRDLCAGRPDSLAVDASVGARRGDAYAATTRGENPADAGALRCFGASSIWRPGGRTDGFRRFLGRRMAYHADGGPPTSMPPLTGGSGGLGAPSSAPRRALGMDRQMDRRAIAAVVLIVIGLLLLIDNLSASTMIGLLILPSLGAIFLTWGILARLVGPLIPGGILTGLGVGIVLQRLWFTADTPAAGGVIVLGLGLGFLVITPLALAVTGERCHWWPLIPGSILSIIGVALLLGNLGVMFLTILGQFWPLILIVVGVYLLWRATNRRGVMP